MRNVVLSVSVTERDNLERRSSDVTGRIEIGDSWSSLVCQIGCSAMTQEYWRKGSACRKKWVLAFEIIILLR